MDINRAFNTIIGDNDLAIVLEAVDEMKPEYVYDWDEEEFYDIHEAYEELGRGEAESHVIAEMIKYYH